MFFAKPLDTHTALWFAGIAYPNVCVNAANYKFEGDNLRKLMMYSPRASLTPVPLRLVPFQTVKQLILARKAYIDKL